VDGGGGGDGEKGGDPAIEEDNERAHATTLVSRRK